MAQLESMNNKTNKPNFTETQKTLLRETFRGIADHCKDTNNLDIDCHKKELNRLINFHIRHGETLERAVDNSFWAVMEAIDIENELFIES